MENQIDKTVTDIQPRPTFRSNMAAVAKGSGFVFSGKLFMDAIRFVIGFALARLLGADQYGMYSLTLSAVNIAVGLSLLGLDDALLRFVAVMVGRKDEKAIWGSIQVGLGLAISLSVVTGTLLFGYSYIVAEKIFHNISLAPLLQLAAVFIPVLSLTEMLAGTVKGFKRIDYSVIARSYFQPTLRLILIVILAFSGLDAYRAVFIFCLAELAASGLLLYYLNREFRLNRPLREATRDFKGILEYSLPIWLSDMMVKFQGNIQAIALGALNTMTSVGIFSIARQITMVSGHFTSSLNVSSKPFLAQLYDQRDFKQLGQIYQTANKWAVMVQLPIFLIMFLFPITLLSIFGESYIEGAAALMVLAVADLLSVGTGMGGAFLEMTGYTKLKLVNSIIRLGMYIGVGLWLIPQYGVIGAAFSVLAGEGLVNILRVIEVYILFKLFPFNMGFIKPVIAAGCAAGGVLILGLWIPLQENLLNAFSGMMLLLMVYAAVTYLLGFSKEETFMLDGLRNHAQKLSAKLKRKKRTGSDES
jgi:O-antigen/teichoic acid export membrane protein